MQGYCPNCPFLVFERMQRDAAPLQIAWKQYPDFTAAGVQKHPHLDWAHVSDVPARVWVQKVHECRRRLGSPEKCNLIDTAFATVARGLFPAPIFKTTKGRFEVFVGGRWELDLRFDDLCDEIKRCLESVFAYGSLNAAGEEVAAVPPDPLQSGPFIKRVCEAVVLHAQSAQLACHRPWSARCSWGSSSLPFCIAVPILCHRWIA